MAGPTVESRRRKRFILMSSDAALEAALRAALPEGWQMVVTNELDSLGGFEEILQFRFLLLDLDERDAFDPLDVVRQVRMELVLNLAILCFGGTRERRDAARLSRADRFFERAEMPVRMVAFCDQYGW